MDFTQWIQLTLICILGAISPGPSLAVILRNSILGGRRQGIMSGIGHGLGITFYAIVVVIGLVTFFKTNPFFLIFAQSIGSLFLFFVGFKMIITFLYPKEDNSKSDFSKITGKQGFLEGFLISFFNPKIAAWVLALFSQFVKPDASILEQLILISTVGGIDATWYCIVATITTSGGLVSGLKSNAKRIDFGMGILLILVSLGMFWRLISTLF